MANPNFKGRQKGSIKKTSTISDPLLGDYKIVFDDLKYFFLSPICFPRHSDCHNEDCKS